MPPEKLPMFKDSRAFIANIFASITVFCILEDTRQVTRHFSFFFCDLTWHDTHTKQGQNAENDIFRLSGP